MISLFWHSLSLFLLLSQAKTWFHHPRNSADADFAVYQTHLDRFSSWKQRMASNDRTSWWEAMPETSDTGLKMIEILHIIIWLLIEVILVYRDIEINILSSWLCSYLMTLSLYVHSGHLGQPGYGVIVARLWGQADHSSTLLWPASFKARSQVQSKRHLDVWKMVEASCHMYVASYCSPCFRNALTPACRRCSCGCVAVW